MSGINSRGTGAAGDKNKETQSQTPPPADGQPAQAAQLGQAGQPHNIMADVIARHEAAIYRLKK